MVGSTVPSSSFRIQEVATQMLADAQGGWCTGLQCVYQVGYPGAVPRLETWPTPEKLEMMEKIAESIQQEQVMRAQQTEQHQQRSVRHQHGGWDDRADLLWQQPSRPAWHVVPSQEVLLTLSKLYRCLRNQYYRAVSGGSLLLGVLRGFHSFILLTTRPRPS